MNPARISSRRAWAWLGFAALLAGGLAAANPMITGTATYRERMLLPAAAVFEATLEDASRADAPATVLGRARIEGPGAPPIRFAIGYDPAAIVAGRRYVVRARVSVYDQTMYVTDAGQPVLGPGGATHVDLALTRVGSKPRPPGTAASATAQRMRGAYTYLADAGRFVDCASGRSLAVAQEGDNAALEAAYGKARAAPGTPVLVAVDARVESRAPMEGAQRQPTLVVERFVAVLPGADCKALDAAPTLEVTSWKLAAIRGAAVPPGATPREAHMVLEPLQRRIGGSGGCNRFTGSYTLDGERLAFSRLAGTQMACVQGMDVEHAFLDALAGAERWRIAGRQLELLDAAGNAIATFTAAVQK